ncbi:MAG: hypothetical protein U0271_25285 [Polyangiaceae bacterium]
MAADSGDERPNAQASDARGRSERAPAQGPAPAPSAEDAAGLRRARRITAIVFLLAVGTWVAAASGQIVQQAIFPKVPSAPYHSCAEGVVALHGALERARGESEGDLPPEVALVRFRKGLEPEWTLVEAVRASCKTDEERRSLDALERLRYAEEHAVRREASSLTALRRQVASDVAKLAHP